MNEPALIRAITRWVGALPGGGLIAGIGDDCAIVRPRANEDLLITTDLVVEDVHFARSTHTLPSIGAKCLARGLSDIAAMGGEPRFALLSLTLAPWTGRRQLRAFYHGATQLAALHKVRIIGGDITRAERFSADVVVIGAVPRGRALRRDTARPGDGIYVSGPLGRAAASNWKTAVEPRIALGIELRRRHRATSCIDLSDGLALDLHRLLLASGLSAEINTAAIPLAPRATLDQALHGGEDYELLYTLPATARRSSRSQSTLIGYATSGPAGRIRLDGKPLPPLGWDPFRR